MNMHIVRARAGVLAAAAVALVAAGCGNDDSPTTPTPPTSSTVTFSASIQRDILTPACEGCHTDNGRTPAGQLNLRTGMSYSMLVGVASSGKSGATRVIAGNPSGSYLIQKIEGAADIVGSRMPSSA